ncbi:MAG: glutamyl-tRNA amidotransferase [Lachnospiraceae bacterium]|nr:glutamyl-tRNA amidotransferase [Lachnospiraceae bacterium]
MSIFKKKKKKQLSNPQDLERRVKRGFRLYAAAVLCGALMLGTAVPAFAAGSDPLTVIDNLSTFIFGLIRAVGIILLGWGIVQVGMSLQSHDPSQRSNGFLTLAGGIVITFAREILDLIIG